LFNGPLGKFFLTLTLDVVRQIICLSASKIRPNVGPETAAPRGDSEIVFGAVTADDLRPEPRNVHRLDAAVNQKSSYGV
jgi:hypothetical protein